MIALFKACLIFSLCLFFYYVGRKETARRYEKAMMKESVKDEQSVKRGHWKDIMMSEATGWDLSLTGGRDAVCETVCSVCGGGCAFDGDGEALLSQYCPDCGADMRGEDNDT